MARPSIFCLLTLCLVLLASSVVAGGDRRLSWLPMGESIMVDDEFMMESEISRRILATSDYISYDALQRNTVPCSQRGASYYNCQTGAEANPYDRGCSAITQCRS